MALHSTPLPVRVELARNGARIVIDWQDGRTTEHDAFALRASCPCALCVDELSGKRLVAEESIDPAVAAVEWGRVGRYALRFTWSDGHSTGIYPYRLLRDEADGSAPR